MGEVREGGRKGRTEGGRKGEGGRKVLLRKEVRELHVMC